ncbi:TrbI/VirB10 family protein [Tolypothrix sp. PCC 7910]|uniref:TrbI/VirB10 family protein n=1 Tax=Tolypothrix sp. PCC 7910 TaxID=2099387 RepID=UPI0014278717|nr:TrbI/VirB10 family protein [Tolypothrix sp. PCC 7910]
MTKMLISSESPPQDLVLLKSDDSPLEVHSDEWELRIAHLVGFEEESASVDIEAVSEAAESQPSLPEPSEVKTEQSLSSNPFAKLGVVSTATLAIVLVAGTFLSQLMGSNQKPKKNIIVSPEMQPTTTKDSISEDLAAEVETLKTKLALTEQADAIKLAQQKLRSGKLISTTQLANQRNSQPDTFPDRRTVLPIIPTPPLPPSAVNAPRVVTVERIVRPPYPQQTPFPLPSLLPQPIATNPTPQPIINVTPSPTPNPLQEWAKLAKLGSYGQVAVNSTPNVNTTTAINQGNEQVPPQTNNPQSEQTPRQQTSVVSQVAPQSPKSIAIGSSAKAVLATAVFGETSKSSNSDNKNVFVVRLKEPLKAVDGAIAIPANTELLAEIGSLSEQGLLQLKVVKIIAKENGNLTERSLPENAMMVRASQGRPLIANQFPNRGSSILGMDIGLFVLGGLGKAAELTNRTESQVVTTNAGGTIISNTNPQRNIWAGVLEGGMNTVVPQITQRNQQAIAQMSQRSNVWFLPAGTAVEIYVNQLMQL